MPRGYELTNSSPAGPDLVVAIYIAEELDDVKFVVVSTSIGLVQRSIIDQAVLVNVNIMMNQWAMFVHLNQDVL